MTKKTLSRRFSLAGSRGSSHLAITSHLYPSVSPGAAGTCSLGQARTEGAGRRAPRGLQRPAGVPVSAGVFCVHGRHGPRGLCPWSGVRAAPPPRGDWPLLRAFPCRVSRRQGRGAGLRSPSTPARSGAERGGAGAALQRRWLRRAAATHRHRRQGAVPPALPGQSAAMSRL